MSHNYACLFPGQGSQSIGMLAELAANHSSIRQTFERASKVLGYDLWQLAQHGPAEKLNQTEYTQAVMLTADVALYELLNSYCQLQPSVLAGHSLGEYAALVCGGALSLEDAAILVSHRGRLMQQTIPAGKGAMAAIIGLDDEQVAQICIEACDEDTKVTPANYNSVGQVVIAGHTLAVDRAIAKAELAEARLAKVIAVSVPCHCDLLSDAAVEFQYYLAQTEFSIPKVGVISNVNLSLHQTPEAIRDLLKKQLTMPVRWVETIEKIKQQGIDCMFEIGPGKVLSGLVKRIDRTIKVQPVCDPASFEKALVSLGEEHVV